MVCDHLVAHKHVDLNALVRLGARAKLRRRRRSVPGNGIASRHHGTELAASKRD
jgi:hypothetical protein